VNSPWLTLEDLLPFYDSPRQAERAFALFDVDNDSSVDYAEVAEHVSDLYRYVSHRRVRRFE
jgi:Ca2+-binding EF-hand superfamily protein